LWATQNAVVGHMWPAGRVFETSGIKRARWLMFSWFYVNTSITNRCI